MSSANEVAVVDDSVPAELRVVEGSRASALALITDDRNMERINALAKTMASAKVTVPKHLQGNEGDCAAIIMQSMQWGMSPYAVAQKTHLVNGTLGYEAQLVNAVIQQSGIVKGRFHYEFKGEGNAIECRVGAVIAGETDITWGEWLKISSVTTQNSPLWKTNPKQQMGYLQVKNWARLYAPGAILGVYTNDELQSMPAKEINPRNGAQVAEAAQKGRVIDTADEELRVTLVAELEEIAKQGVVAFKSKFKDIGKPNRELVGVADYERILVIAQNADNAGTSEALDAEFVGQMNAAEQRT